MIADALRHEIELHADRARTGNRLLHLVRDGRVEPEAIGRYLVMLRYMIGNTPGNLMRATERAAENGRPDLAAYYTEKLAEEDGHEQWAIDDLAVFQGAYGFRPDPEPVPATVELQTFLENIIEVDPVLYLSYVFWAEYFVVLVGGEYVQCLVERCGLPPAALTCLANHVVLDDGHTDENIEAIDRLVGDPRYLVRMREVLRRAMELFDRSTEQMIDGVVPVEQVAS
jgi:hypothetical protein